MKTFYTPTWPRTAASLSLLSLALCAHAQTKPPQAQAWIDVATYSGMGMPMGGMAGAAANPLAALGSLFGGGGGGGGGNNTFGSTQSGSAGRWVDVTLSSRDNPSLGEAQQAVPAGFLSPALKLQAPKETRGRAPPSDDSVVEPEAEQPRGRILLYWGCGSAVRAGQPKVLDMATASAADLSRFYVSRRATQRGAHQTVGRPVWPSQPDSRMVPANASLVGEHSFGGTGLPEGFRFQIAAAQDLMPALNLQTQDSAGATQLNWTGAPTARAYFATAMKSNEKGEMVLWTSSEQPDTGMGLVDYQTNAAVDRWLREKVLLAPATTTCTVPKGVLGAEGAMLRVIAYGSEINLVHPPRPADPKAPWEPVWAAKVRVKSVASAMPGMTGMTGMPGKAGASESAGSSSQSPAPAEPAGEAASPLNILRGLFGR